MRIKSSISIIIDRDLKYHDIKYQYIVTVWYMLQGV